MTETAQYPGVGLVETQTVELFTDEPLQLENGETLGPITVAYEVYGALNERRDNAILLCHALSGGAHAAGYHPGDQKPGWWDIMIGPGKAFDTDRYCMICPNVLGSCYGTTGPSSINPKTGKPYALNFPVVTVPDMVNVEAKLLDHLGIETLLCVAGGSMGGMVALQWAVSYPQRVKSTLAIASTHQHSPQQIAFNEVARQSIMADPAWNKGDYYDSDGPTMGLAIGRMVGHVTYLSEEGMRRKFGRRLRDRERFGYDFSLDFEVESYLRHQGQSFVSRFDANSLLYLTKALDYFDLSIGYSSLTEAFGGARGSLFLLIAFSSDWLYPPHHLKEVARAIRRSGGDATYYEIHSDYGHDAFLLEYEKQEPLVRSFLKRAQTAWREQDAQRA
ncbi:MAG TPA: homoserine O-acetyltransferase [Candidatus Sumerlaeota bacterium]|nr:homoserine O-acetyltransferase [Candidatus Sumerlaeota bacterium]